MLSHDHTVRAVREPARPSSGLRGGIVAGALCCFALGAHPGAAGAQSLRLAPPVADSALVVLDDDGLRFHSPDRREQLKVRGYFEVDARLVGGDSGSAVPDGFSARRTRLYFDANLNRRVAFRLLLDLATPGVAPVGELLVDVDIDQHWWVRAGKMKPSFGGERLLSTAQQFLPERSIASQLTPARDDGVMLTGEYAGDRIEGTVGLFDGVPDGTYFVDGDVNNPKDVLLRFVYRPVWRSSGQGITLGVNATDGIEQGTRTNDQLPRYLSPASVAFFAYRESAGAIASGSHVRAGVFSSAHFGRWGANAEWIHGAQRVTVAGSTANVGASSWVGGVDYVLTGEPSVQGAVSPAKPFDPDHGHWGAVQAVVRVAGVTIGHEAFPVFADPAVAAHAATEVGVGLNWFITRVTRAQLAIERTSYTGGAVIGDRPAEPLALLRLQLGF